MGERSQHGCGCGIACGCGSHLIPGLGTSMGATGAKEKKIKIKNKLILIIMDMHKDLHPRMFTVAWIVVMKNQKPPKCLAMENCSNTLRCLTVTQQSEAVHSTINSWCQGRAHNMLLKGKEHKSAAQALPALLLKRKCVRTREPEGDWLPPGSGVTAAFPLRLSG